MPNGETVDHSYVDEWCEKRHEELNNDIEWLHHRVDNLDGRLWKIMILLVGNLIGIMGAIGGIAGVFIKIVA